MPEVKHDFLEVEVWHQAELLHSYRMDALTDADLAVAEVRGQVEKARTDRPIRFIGYQDGSLFRLTRNNWADAVRCAVAATEEGDLRRVQLRVLLDDPEEDTAAKPAAAGGWEVQLDQGWVPFLPGKCFNHSPQAEDEFMFFRHERRYKATFKGPFEGIQLNLTTLRNRPLRRVVEQVEAASDAKGPAEGIYKIVLAGGDNPKSTFDQLGWELCAHRVQTGDKRSTSSTYLMLHKPSDGKSAAGRACNHFKLEQAGDGYRILLHSGDNPDNKYEQEAWQLSALRAMTGDTRATDSTYASLQAPTEGLQASRFLLQRFGKAYKIVLAAGEGQAEEADWELCAHRSLAKDQRSKISTYTMFMKPGDNRTCNHFTLERLDKKKDFKPVPRTESKSNSEYVGRVIRGADGNIWGKVVADEGAAWKLESGRVAKKQTEGSKWNWEPLAADASPTVAGFAALAASTAKDDDGWTVVDSPT